MQRKSYDVTVKGYYNGTFTMEAVESISGIEGFANKAVYISCLSPFGVSKVYGTDCHKTAIRMFMEYHGCKIIDIIPTPL
jgi:hypothetical protein